MALYQRELRLAEAVARQAGRHILKERERSLKVSFKGPRDLVTDVDRSTEELIVAELTALFPEDEILGEELGESGAAGGGRRWIIDPIDGTQNFAKGIPFYCVSIGLQVSNTSVVGAIYDPSRDELFSAARGQGTFLNGAPVQVSDVTELGDTLAVTDFPRAREGEFECTLRQFARLNRTCRGLRRLGSAALDLAYVASGRLDAYWVYTLRPWDTAAGYLMVEEAGGRVTDIDGAPFKVETPSLLATNGHLHEALLLELQSEQNS